MSEELTFMGSAKVGGNLRVSIVKDVAEKMGLKDGDHVVYYMDKDGRIILKKG